MELCSVGGYHGFVRLAEDDLKSFLETKRKAKDYDTSNSVGRVLINLLKWISTFTIIVIGWVLFRVNRINDFFYIMAHLFDDISTPFMYIKEGLAQLGIRERTLLELIVIVLSFVMGETLLENSNVIIKYVRPNRAMKWILYLLLFLFVIFMVPRTGNRNFIYFQF